MRRITSAVRVLLVLIPLLAGAAEKPNIIYILADDLGYGYLGCYGQTIIKTPHLDRMATEGMRFTDHYAGSTVCAPSRCSLMTGKHTGHTSIVGNNEVDRKEFPMGDKGAAGQQPLKEGEVTLGLLAKKAGYHTACIGKWGLGGLNSSGDPNKVGFDHFFGYLDQRDAHYFFIDWLWRNGKPVELKDNPVNPEDARPPLLAVLQQSGGAAGAMEAPQSTGEKEAREDEEGGRGRVAL